MPFRTPSRADHPGSTATSKMRSSDILGLAALVTAVRWGAITLGLLWAVALRSGNLKLEVGAALLGYALVRTVRPLDYNRKGWLSFVPILIEVAVSTVACLLTGCWDSPYIFMLFTPVIAAGFARGMPHALRISVTEAAVIGITAWSTDQSSGWRPAVTWCGELFLVALIASFGRRELLKMAQRRAQAQQLNEANTMLVGLNRLAHELPVSFDFQDTVAFAFQRIQNVLQPDVGALLLLDPDGTRWSVAMTEGVRLSDSIEDFQLPEHVKAVAHSREPEMVRELGNQATGISDIARSGLYAPLWAGDRHIGLFIAESSSNSHFTEGQLAKVRQLLLPTALMIDNARWFARLHSRGAAQERVRIARDLHDRVGQGLAYVAFELDRLQSQWRDTELQEELDRLRVDARGIVGELRETLYDLRTEVSGERDLADTVVDFLDRVETRSDIKTTFRHIGTATLAIAEERELWRIAQEAIVNAERHAEPSCIEVEWRCWPDGAAVLTVADDGKGMTTKTSASPGRPAYGLTGMRERADAIGAMLEIGPNEPSGTKVRVTVGSLPTNDDSRETTGA